MNILQWYLGRTLIITILSTLAVLLVLSGLLKFMDQLGRIGEGSYSMADAWFYVLLSMPRDIEIFFPMATLLGGLIGMGMLASHSELTVMQAAGISKRQIIFNGVKAVLILIVLLMLMGELVTGHAETQAKRLRTEALGDKNIFTSTQGTWTKDGQAYVSIGKVIDTTHLAEIKIFQFNDSRQLEKITAAKRAEFFDDEWHMHDITMTTFTSEEIATEMRIQTIWPTALTPDKLEVVSVKPEALSPSGLYEYIQYLRDSEQDSRRYELALWRKLLQPISISVMLFLAFSFIFGPLRSQTMGSRIMLGALTGFGFFITNRMFGPFALVYDWAPIFGALLPSLVFTGLAIVLLKRQ